ncbi:nuclear transport factor 2 family protein [Lentzea sp. NPDC042327]|uniref:nuclear transport factor 2 family protein n=1 Tax=Lentzea sp. NPDC042327 TaxID=3154801 RepID=UPI0033F3A40B
MLDRALDLLIKKDMAGFAGLWAEDGRMEFPFAPEGWPREVTGRAGVRHYMRDYPKMIDVREVLWQRVHRTADPAVTVAEFDLGGELVASGKPFRNRYVVVITERDGQIAEWRDYWNPLAVEELS